MNQWFSNKWVRAAVLMLCEGIAAVLIARMRGFGMDVELYMNARHLSDGLFVVGMMATGLGALAWISTTGFFDMMGYGIQYGVRAFVGLFGGNRKPNDKDFYAYKVEKDEKRGKPRFTLLLTGVACIAISALMLAVYYA